MTEREGPRLFRRCKQIALQAFLFGFEDLQSPAFLCGQLRVLNAQITQYIWNAHDDAVGADVAEHAADGALIEFHKRVEFGCSHMVTEQPLMLSLVDCPHELRVDVKPSAESLLTTRPVAKAPRISFAGRLEGRHACDPSACGVCLLRQADHAHADRSQSAVIRRTVRRKRPARIEISPPVAELKFRLGQAFDLYRRRHRSVLPLEHRVKQTRPRAGDPQWAPGLD
jgi:hypothetical protein